MRQIINSATITQRVQGWLTSTDSARILHVFDQACNLINEDREILSIVTRKVGPGPFNLVTDNDICFAEHLTAQSPVAATPTELHLGDLTLRWDDAKLWNPTPDWKSMHAQRASLCRQVRQLPITNYFTPARTSAVANTPVLMPMLQSSHSLAPAVAIADLPASVAAAKRLAGSGIGLTPSGDDYLMGAIYAAWIIHPWELAQEIAGQIADAATRLTTSLSGAWLRAASEGEAGILWHRFFEASIFGEESSIQMQFSAISSVGETSGADALAGFIDTMLAFEETQNKHVISQLV